MSKDALKKAIEGARESKKKGDIILSKEEAVSNGLELVDDSDVCMLGTIGADGFPNIKAMMNVKYEGLKKIWFGTNTSSKKVQQLKKDNRACIYYMDNKGFRGLMLIGTIEILQDTASRKMLWMEGMEVYYPLGVEDPDYSVLCFTAERGNYFQALKNVSFEID